MQRVCGANGEEKAWYAARCWCGGLFCRRGGFKMSQEFRRDFRTKLTALDRAQFEELVRQPSLFESNALREKWIARLDAHAVSPARVDRKRVGRRRPAAQEGEADAGTSET